MFSARRGERYVIRIWKVVESILKCQVEVSCEYLNLDAMLARCNAAFVKLAILHGVDSISKEYQCLSVYDYACQVTRSIKVANDICRYASNFSYFMRWHFGCQSLTENISCHCISRRSLWRATSKLLLKSKMSLFVMSSYMVHSSFNHTFSCFEVCVWRA